jgi:hypothetical protein
MPPDLARAVYNSHLTVQQVVRDHLPHFAVVRDAANSEWVQHTPQPRREVHLRGPCPAWSPERGTGCDLGCGCEHRHGLPAMV